MHTYQYILLNRHFPEEVDILIGSRNTNLIDLIWLPSLNLLSEEIHCTAIRFVYTANAVEEGGLSGTIRADEAGDLIRLDMNADLVDCCQAAEFDGNLIRLKHSTSPRFP